MKKKILRFFSLLVLVFCAVTFTACASNGMSAYDIAVKNGFQGTEVEWLESLKGETGSKGDKGDTGAQGQKGDKGDTGAQGAQGNLGGTPSINYDSTNDVWYIVSAGFQQEAETLEGTLVLNVGNLEDFGKVTYSVYREGYTADYVDYIKKDVVLENGDNTIELTAPYYGNYELSVSYYLDAADEEPVNVYTKEGINFTASHYNFVYSNSTLPVLYSACELVTLDHSYPTYVAINRNSTFDWYELPENCYAVPMTTFQTKTTNLALFDDEGNQLTSEYGAWVNGSWGAIYANSSTVTPALHQIKDWIGDLYAMDEDATFTFYVDDTISNVALWWIYGNNINEDNYVVNMYTEGSSSNSTIVKNGLTMDAHEAMMTSFEEYVQNLREGEDITTIWATKYSFCFGAQENVNYIVNNKESLLNSLNKTDADYEAYRTYIDEILTQYSIEDAFTDVEEAGKTEELEFLLRTRWTDSSENVGSANQYFENNNGKKNLMIIGTSVTGENNSNGCGVDTTLMTFMDYIVEKYGEEYNIFYKGHPSYPINRFDDGRAEYFAENGIVVLPNAVPAETYMYLYENVYVGGYYSSTMASSMVGQTLFFIGTEENIKAQGATASMFDSTADDYLGTFEVTEFITVESIEE